MKGWVELRWRGAGGNDDRGQELAFDMVVRRAGVWCCSGSYVQCNEKQHND